LKLTLRVQGATDKEGYGDGRNDGLHRGVLGLSFGNENWLMLREAGVGINTMETILRINVEGVMSSGKKEG